jgi:protocatechuate 3,4-dioxygenase beta subunit
MMHSRYRLLPVITALLVLLVAACNGTPATPDDQAQSGQLANTPTPVVVAEEAAAASPTAPAPTPTLEPVAEPTPTTAPVQATATAQPEIAPATEEPLEEPSPTPVAAEDEPSSAGETPAQAAFPDPPTAQGEVIVVTGRVLDVTGAPIPAAAVEIWQTDANGVYDHPGDSGTSRRDQGFQFYGTSIADASGVYAFRTVRPGEYEPRPRHIHVKVKIDGQEVLTTQFYFQEDQAGLPGEGVFSQAGSQGDLLLLTPAGSVDLEGIAVPVLSNDLVIDTSAGAGTLSSTPAQSEGPYYPVVMVAEYDNDLVVVP